MAEYYVTAPDGKKYKVTAPEGATKDELVAAAQRSIAAAGEETSPGYQLGRGANSSLQGLAAAMQGPTFGFADEISGAINAPLQTLLNDQSLAENYRNIRDRYRGMADASRANNPWTTGITQAMTSAPWMALKAPFAGGGSPQGWTENTARAAAAAAAYSGTQGGGESTAGTPLGVGEDILRSAGTGTVFGAGGKVVVGDVLGAVGKNVGQRISDKWAGTAAQQKVAEALARDARGQHFISGQGNPAAQAQAQFRKLGPEATVADAGGANTRQLLDTLATLPGRTKESAASMLGRRQSTVGNRMRTAADEALGTGGQRLPTTIDDLIAQRTEDSMPLYDIVRTLTVSPSKELKDILAIASAAGALKEARKSAVLDGVKFTYDPKNPARIASLSDMDQVKRGLDQMINGEMNPLTMKLSPIGAKYVALKSRLTKELDAVTTDPITGVSSYAQARAAFAGPSALMDAANAGKRAIAQDEAGIVNAMKGMGADELQAFRIGAHEGLRIKLGTRSGQTAIMNMKDELTQQEKLKVIFGDLKSYRQFAASVSREGALKRLQKIGVGSQTAARQEGIKALDVAADVSQAATAAQTGNVVAAMGPTARAWRSVATPQAVRDQMGQILLSKGAAGQKNLYEMQDLIRRMNERQALHAQQFGLLGSQVPVQ